MKRSEAVTRADELRQNAIEDRIKAGWVEELDAKVCDMMGITPSSDRFPKDAELAMPFPYDNIYPLYAAAMIDYYNMETSVYEMDMAVFKDAYYDACSAYQRENGNKGTGRFAVM